MERRFTCPVCEERIWIEEYIEEEDILECPECFAELQVVGLDPLIVKVTDGSFGDDDDELFEGEVDPDDDEYDEDEEGEDEDWEEEDEYDDEEEEDDDEEEEDDDS